MHRITDWCQTHGMQPVSEDFTPSARLGVRLLPPSIFYTLVAFCFSLLSHFFHKALEGRFAHCSHTLDVLRALIIPGGFFNRRLLIRALCPTHVSNFRMYLLFTIICIDMTKVLAKLGCLAPVLTPTFPIVRLGGKGSTSAIVTAGSVGRVPQTG